MLGIETLAQRWREHSASCAAAMARIFPSYRYNISTVLAEGRGSMSRSMATTTMFWLALVKARSYPPPLMAGSRGRFLGLSPGGVEVRD
jgi:hypothetical protein